MERLEKREWLALAVLFLLVGGLFSYLPFSGQSVFLSPDETGVFVAAKNVKEQGTIALAESYASTIPWLHPRSWISHGSTIVPVGFLGWPWIMSWFIRFGDQFASIGAMLVILSAIYPFYRLLRPMGKIPAFIGTIVAFTAPALILYGNRSLFPNAGFVALAIWTAWMFRDIVIPAKAGIQLSEGKNIFDRLLFKLDPSVRWDDKLCLFLFGLLSGLTLAIRPVEMFWLLPWFIFLGWNWRPTLKQVRWILLGLLIALIPIIWQAQTAYGGFWKAGYWMKGNIVSTAGIRQNTAVSPEVFPFGIHPKNIAYNAWTFLLGPLFPWMVPLLMLFVLFVASIARDLRVIPAPPLASLAFGGKAGIQNRLNIWISTLAGTGSPPSRGRQITLIAFWSFASLILYYGNGKYLDNINGLATIGNSYVRYLLPLGFLAGLAIAWLYRVTSPTKYGRHIIITMTIILAFTGIWRAYAADGEGLIAGKQELNRYAQIRSDAGQWFKSGDIIISERSDKIFFPEYRAVSPLPDMNQALQLSNATEQGIHIGLFARPLGQSQADAWRKVGLDPVELAAFGREKLYRLQPINP